MESRPLKTSSWDDVLSALKTAQDSKTEGEELGNPCVFCGDNYLLWCIKNYHFHPLSITFPQGFLLLHNQPTSVQTEGVDLASEVVLDQAAKTTDAPANRSASSSRSSLPSDPLSSANSHVQLQQVSGVESNHLSSGCLVGCCLSRLPMRDALIGYFGETTSQVPEEALQPSVELAGEEVSSPAVLGPFIFPESYAFSQTHSTLLKCKKEVALQVETAKVKDLQSPELGSSGHVSTSFFHFLFMERRCVPVAISDASILYLLIQRLLRLNRLRLLRPLAIMVNDNGPETYNWDLLMLDEPDDEALVASSSEISDRVSDKENRRGCLEETLHNDVISPQPRHSACDEPLDGGMFSGLITPAPVPRRSATAAVGVSENEPPKVDVSWALSNHIGLDEDVFMTFDDTQKGPPRSTLDSEPEWKAVHRFCNWSAFSRMTYLCVFDANETYGVRRPYRHTADPVNQSSDYDFATAEHQVFYDPKALAFCDQVKSDQLNVTQKAFLASAYHKGRYRCVTVRIPVLPQENMFGPLPLPPPISTASSAAHSLSVGAFLLRIMPEKFLRFVEQTIQCKGRNVNALSDSNPRSLSDKVISSVDVLNQSIALYGPPVATARFDLIYGAPYAGKLCSLLTDAELKENVLLRRASLWDVSAAPGPLVSLHVSWNTPDVWGTHLYPVFPAPDSATTGPQTPEASITFRTGVGKNSYLFWMWSDLVLLHNMRHIRAALAGSSQEICANNSAEQRDAEPAFSASERSALTTPVHHLEETRVRDLFSTVGPNIADVEEKTTEKTSKTTAGLPSHYRLQYQVANKGKLLEGIQDFLAVQRRIGEGTVKRRVQNTFSGVATGCVVGNSWEPSFSTTVETICGTVSTNNNACENRLASVPTGEKGINETLSSPKVTATVSHQEILQSSYGLQPPPRPDSDFADCLWQFIRRGYDVEDMYLAMQEVLDAIGASILHCQANSESTLRTKEALSCHRDNFAFAQRPKRSSILGFDKSLQRTIPPQPLLPSLRKNSSSKLASLIRLAIRGSQLQRYTESSLGLTDKTHLGGSSNTVDQKAEIKNLQEEWKRLRDYYRQPIHCVDLLHEIGVEALYRDAVAMIQQADPSIPLSTLEYFNEGLLPIPTLLARLARLHKLAELAALSRAIRLPWDPTRCFLRQALNAFKALPLDNDPGRHPVFALGLTRQAFRTVFHFWASREPETLFKIRLGKVVEASFLRVNSDMELRQLKKLFDVYPRDMPASQPPEERSDEELEEISQYPLYLWKTFMRELRPSKTPFSDPANGPKPGGIVPFFEPLANDTLFYTLQLQYEDPIH